MADFNLYRDIGQLKLEQEKTRRNIKAVIRYLSENDKKFKEYMRTRKHENKK